MRRQMTWLAFVLGLMVFARIPFAESAQGPDCGSAQAQTACDREQVTLCGQYKVHCLHEPAPINWLSHPFDSGDYNVYGGSIEEAPGEPMSPPFILLLLNFGLWMALVVWKIFPVLRRFIKSRSEGISNALEESAKLQRVAEKKLTDYNARVADAESEADALISSIRGDAQKEKARVLAEGKARASALLIDADNRIASQTQSAQLSLQKKVVTQAVVKAAELLKQKITAQDHTSLIDNFIVDLENNTAYSLNSTPQGDA